MIHHTLHWCEQKPCKLTVGWGPRARKRLISHALCLRTKLSRVGFFFTFSQFSVGKVVFSFASVFRVVRPNDSWNWISFSQPSQTGILSCQLGSLKHGHLSKKWGFDARTPEAVVADNVAWNLLEETDMLEKLQRIAAVTHGMSHHPTWTAPYEKTLHIPIPPRGMEMSCVHSCSHAV